MTEATTTHLAAARARAAGQAPLGDRQALAGLPAQVWRSVEAGGSLRLAFTPDCQLNDGPVDDLPVSRLTPGQARALLAVLAATRTDADHPWPGRPATVREVLSVLGGAELSTGVLTAAKGALRKLHLHDLIVLGDPADPDPDTVDDDLAVRIGPAVAAWSGPWVGEVVALAAAVAASRGRP